jgi:hypothetical protein
MTDATNRILQEIRQGLVDIRLKLDDALNSIELDTDADEIGEDEVEAIALVEDIDDLDNGAIAIMDNIDRILKESQHDR